MGHQHGKRAESMMEVCTSLLSWVDVFKAVVRKGNLDEDFLYCTFRGYGSKLGTE